MDYVNVPTSEKKELPDWLNYQIVKGSIIFYGIPRFLDEGEIKIRIKNADDFVLKEFWINVQAPDEEDLENLEYLKNQLPHVKNSSLKDVINSQNNFIEISERDPLTNYPNFPD